MKCVGWHDKPSSKNHDEMVALISKIQISKIQNSKIQTELQLQLGLGLGIGIGIVFSRY